MPNSKKLRAQMAAIEHYDENLFKLLDDQYSKNTKTASKVACEYSRLSFAPATTCETRRETSAIHGQKFHTDDVNLSGIRTGALIGQLGNLHNVCEI